MKKLLLVPALLAGCASSPPPQHVYANVNVPAVQIVVDPRVQQMSRQEVISATQDCESNGMRAVPIMSKRLISGMMSDIIIDVQCMPKPKYPY